MQIFEFNKSRVCGIDYYPFFLEALKESYIFCRKYNIPYNIKSKDIQKFFYHYCLEKICKGYQNCKTQYPKAIIFYPLPKEFIFKEKFLQKIIKVLPLPWVKVNSIKTPDLELALEKTLTKSIKSKNNLNRFCKQNTLHDFYNKNKKIKNFTLGTVDFSGVAE